MTNNEQQITNQTEIERLHRLIVWGRWIVVMLFWVMIAPFSLRQLQPEIALWFEHFTWTAVRYGLAHHRWSTFGLSLCIGLTTAVLVWQSRNILLGFPPQYQARLEQQVRQIRQQGSSHPLWKWVIHHSSQNSSTNSLE